MDQNQPLTPPRSLPAPPEDYDSHTDDEDSEFDPRRIWIGNISSSVSMSAFLKIVKRYGRLTKFHFTGCHVADQPTRQRSYCFVTYRTKEEADRCWKDLDGKLIANEPLRLGRPHPEQRKSNLTQSKFAGKNQEPVKKPPELTTESKIRAIEAKLALMAGIDQATAKGVDVTCIPPPRAAISITTQAALAAAAPQKTTWRSTYVKPKRRSNKPYHRK